MRPQRVWILDVLVINLGIDFGLFGLKSFKNRVWFLHSSLELGMRFFRRSFFFIIIDKYFAIPLRSEVGH